TRVGAGRGNVDDAPPPGLDHSGQDGLAAVERTGEVDPDHLVPVLRGQLQEAGHAGAHPSVVYQDAHGTEIGPDLVDGGKDALAVADVGGQPNGLTAILLDRSRGVAGRCSV